MNAKANKKVNVTGKGFGVSTGFYVVLRSDTGEFFVNQREVPGGDVTAWGKTPGEALRISSFDDARKLAVMLSSQKFLELEVCSVTDLGQQYAVQTESVFSPELVQDF